MTFTVKENMSLITKMINIISWLKVSAATAVDTLRKLKNPVADTSLINRSHIQIKLLLENKLIICALGNLHYQISREKFEPELGFKP